MLRFVMLIFFPVCLFSSVKDISIDARSAILFNPSNGAILYEKNSHEPLSPASVTKVATALYALTLLENRLDEEIVVLQEDIGAQSEEEMKRLNYKVPPHRLIFGASHIGLKKGEILSLRDLFRGMLIPSGNDASNVIARVAAGSVEEFMAGMNLYLKKIGCKNTTFFNPHGQHYPGHQTSAYDMALITAEALKHPFFRETVSASRFQRPKTNKQEATVFMQSNKLLRNGGYAYPNAIGVKTGYHSQAKHCLSAAATKEGRTLILIQLGVEQKGETFKNAIKVFKEAFNEEKQRSVVFSKGEQSFKMEHPALNTPLKIAAPEDLVLYYFPSEKPKIKANLYWSSILLAKKGEQVGEIAFFNEQNVVQKKLPLYAQESPDYRWGYWLQHPSLWGWSVYTALLFTLCVILYLVSCIGKQR